MGMGHVGMGWAEVGLDFLGEMKDEKKEKLWVQEPREPSGTSSGGNRGVIDAIFLFASLSAQSERLLVREYWT